jgi:hypothetical protein
METYLLMKADPPDIPTVYLVVTGNEDRLKAMVESLNAGSIFPMWGYDLAPLPMTINELAEEYEEFEEFSNEAK